MNRVNKDKYYLDIAKQVSKRGTCLRRNYGAVIVKNDEIIATGYTGAPRGESNCTDIGACERQRLNIPSGQNYEMCCSVHAEMNAIISASRRDMIDSTMYLVGFDMASNEEINARPCSICARLIKNSGIKRVYTGIYKED